MKKSKYCLKTCFELLFQGSLYSNYKNRKTKTKENPPTLTGFCQCFDTLPSSLPQISLANLITLIETCQCAIIYFWFCCCESSGKQEAIPLSILLLKCFLLRKHFWCCGNLPNSEQHKQNSVTTAAVSAVDFQIH